jgi:exodeoxyribonuclease V alpha subunit
MPSSTEIRGTFLREKARFGQVVVAQVASDEARTIPPTNDEITVKTECEEGELEEGLQYWFWGRWTTHWRYGRQFIASSFVRVQPLGKAGIMAYIMRAPNIGPARARRLWDLYQGDAVKILREDPERVVREFGGKRGPTLEQALEAAKSLAEEKDVEEATIKLMELLAGRGLPRRTCKNALRVWGNRAAELVRQNPYLLMRFKGCGFARCDELYLGFGHKEERIKRQTLCLWYSMSRDMSGASWFQREWAESTLREKIGGARARPVPAVKLGKRAGMLSVRRGTDGRPWVTERGRDIAEGEIASRVASLLAGTPSWPNISVLEISDHQRDELAKALSRRIGLFGGGPGTGKTHSAAKLVAEIERTRGAGHVAVVAPTGKAAVRITEALACHGLTIRARTIHSYLGVQEVDEGFRGYVVGSDGWSFAHNPSNPVEEEYVIVDESSMCDTEILASLLMALPGGGHLLLVGDVQQLPPVGHGAPLRDLLAAGVPRGELTEIRRNSGLIVETCHRIRTGQDFKLPENMYAVDVGVGRNLCLRPFADSQKACDEIVRLVQSVPLLGELNPVWDVQVVVPVNEKSQLCRGRLNKILQVELNRANYADGEFWPQDKIVCLKNQFLPAVQEGVEDLASVGEEGYVRQSPDGTGPQLYVANGELGRVLEDHPAKLIMRFETPRRTVLAPKGGEGGSPADNFDLGYAVSCHKSQGSEWPVVIVVIDDYPGARLICDRSWVYTAISRAKRACYLVGSESTMRAMVRQQKIHSRKTFLVERLQEALRPVSGGVGGVGGETTNTDPGATTVSVQDHSGLAGESAVPVHGLACAGT